MSAHFSLSELTYSATAVEKGIDNSPTPEALPNLYRLMELLEQVRYQLGGNPMLISSGYRCPELNALIGGADTSAHLSGLASDFICPKFGTPAQIVRHLADSQLNFDQLIEEHAGGKSWVHIGLAPTQYRREVLTYDGKTYRKYR